MQGLLLSIPMFPLLGAIVLLFGIGDKDEKTQRIAGWIATFFAASAFLVTVALFADLGYRKFVIQAHIWDWIEVGTFRASLGLRFDRLAAVMCLIVTGVGSLIHMYAIGYMEHDSSRPRFFCYLNLFLFSMLMLVLGDNLLVMFVGWEGVGLCSYLLIGFWFKDMENAKAGQKAFIVNRIGDAGFLLGIFTLFYAFGGVEFTHINSHVPWVANHLIEWAAFFLFIGAVGKSAQIPLFVWLPDAMAGPTPVSALIHAATMVTSGIYMITRLGALYAAAPKTLLFISVVGAATALFAATIALAQNDIKKVLAYSTVSQLGYMFMALGAGAFSNGVYHVTTHAFFKACLFMGAGSVIVGCHHEQDMRKYGGLWKPMKATFASYLVATLAIAGIPPLSGFFSKDAILWTVYSNPGLPSKMSFGGFTLAQLLWAVGAVTAFLTAFYMTRSLVMTFFGSYRGDHEAHESPWTMLFPLCVLMVLSGVFGIFYGEYFMQYLAYWTRSDMRVPHEVLAANSTYHALELFSIGIAVAGVGLAFGVYMFWPALVGMVSRAPLVRSVHRALLNKWWIDELYDWCVVRPLQFCSQLLFKVVDRALVDGSVNGAGIFVLTNGELVRRLHTGRVGYYAGFMLCGSVCAIVFWLLL